MVKHKIRISSNAEALTMQVWSKSSSYQLDGRDNHILQTKNVEWQSKCLKVQASVSNVENMEYRLCVDRAFLFKCQ